MTSQTVPAAEAGKEPPHEPAGAMDGKAEPGRSFPDETTTHRSSMPVIALPRDSDRNRLEDLVFPPLPYCIFTGAYRDLQEAGIVRREVDSNYPATYIVPVEVSGNIAQSLFGVTQDGIWYRVMTGHFASKDEARQTLGLIIQKMPGYQPEIMRLPYAIECGRFLAPDDGGKLIKSLDQRGIFHYKQTYPTSEGKALTRILVGCYFSEQGARKGQKLLEDKGLSCRIVER